MESQGAEEQNKLFITIINFDPSESIERVITNASNIRRINTFLANRAVIKIVFSNAGATENMTTRNNRQNPDFINADTTL